MSALSRSREPAPIGPVGRPPVDVRDLTLEVPGKRILDSVSLTAGAGEVVAVMGMSGSGKTSLLKCIAGLVKPTAGQILIEGRDIVPLDEQRLNAIRVRLGLVFQYAALFDSLSVFDNVAFGLVHTRHMRRADAAGIVRRLLDDVGLSGTEGLYPAQLSGGMQKRVGVARALAMEPAVLLYDEPTSGLDPVIARHIDNLVVETRERLGVTSLVVSHDVGSVLRIADRVIMLHEGAVVATGSPAEIRASDNPFVREFVGSDDGRGE